MNSGACAGTFKYDAAVPSTEVAANKFVRRYRHVTMAQAAGPVPLRRTWSRSRPALPTLCGLLRATGCLLFITCKSQGLPLFGSRSMWVCRQPVTKQFRAMVDYTVRSLVPREQIYSSIVGCHADGNFLQIRKMHAKDRTSVSVVETPATLSIVSFI